MSIPSPQPAPIDARLRRDPDFVRYWLARTVSTAGSLTTMVAMPVLVYRLSGSAPLTALTSALEAIPYVIFGLVAGALADRWNRKRVMVAADLANVAVIGSVPVAWWFGGLAVAHVLLAGFVSQILFTFFDGANFGALPVLVGRDRVGQANAAVFGVGGVLDLVVPGAVGLALAVIHPADLLVVDALSFLAAAMLVRSIRRALSSAREHRAPMRIGVIAADVREGLSFLVRHPGVRVMTVVGTLQSVAGASFMALAVPYCDRILGIGTSGWRFGLIYSVWGIGGIAASAMTPPLLRRTVPSRLTLIAIPVSGAAGLAVALSSHWVLAVLAMTTWGLAYQLVLIASITYRQQVTPEHLLGRVNTAGRMLSWGIGWTAGSLGASALAGVLDVRGAMVTLTLVGVLAALYAWTSPLRGISEVAADSRGGSPQGSSAA